MKFSDSNQMLTLPRAIEIAQEHLNSGRYSEAKTICSEVLAIDPAYPDALHLLGMLAYQVGESDISVELINRALSNLEKFPVVCNDLGEIYRALERNTEAEKCFRQALLINPHYAEAYNNLGNVLRSLKRLEEAELSYRQAVHLKPHLAEAYCNLSSTLIDLGKFEEGKKAHLQAIQLKPDMAIAYSNFGCALMKNGLFEDAEKEFRQAIFIDPGHADTYNNLGIIQRNLGKFEEAQKAFRQAIQLKPRLALAYNNLGSVLRDVGRLNEAETAIRQAIQLKADFAEAFGNLGAVLKDLHRLDESENAYRQAIQLKTDFAEGYGNLGVVLKDLGRFEEAVKAYRQALEIDPRLYAFNLQMALLSLPVVVSSTEQAMSVTQAFSSALGNLDKIDDTDNLASLGESVGSCQPFYLAYRPGNHNHLLSRYGNIVCRGRQAWLDRQHIPDLNAPPPPRKRPRMAIVCGTVRRHSVWDVLLHGLLVNLDQSRFEVFIYHTSPHEDAETSCARTLVDRFVQGPAHWLRHLAEDKPDIIFYPEIGMDPATVELATLRLAPLQVTSWGHPITSGLSTIDLFLSGELLERADADQDYREKLVRLPGTGACTIPLNFRSKSVDPVSTDIPHDRSITRFLICQEMSKFDPAFDDLYPRIAIATGKCRFWFVRGSKFPWATRIVEKRINNAFSKAGLNPEAYVRFIDWMQREEFLGLIDEMDVFLDTPAFSGFTTAWQAIHRGLPIVTLEGKFMRQRLAAGILRRVGIVDTIAADVEDYVSKASKLALSHDSRKDLRNRLQEAACFADRDISVVRAFEEVLLRALQNTRSNI